MVSCDLAAVDRGTECTGPVMLDDYHLKGPIEVLAIKIDRFARVGIVRVQQVTSLERGDEVLKA